MNCPFCGKENKYANEIGPREYHAECWAIAEAMRAERETSAEAQEAADAINAYTGDNVWDDVIWGFDGIDVTGTEVVDPHGRSMSAVVNGWIIQIDEDNQARGWYVSRPFIRSDWGC